MELKSSFERKDEIDQVIDLIQQNIIKYQIQITKISLIDFYVQINKL
jgi:hypothetical protein